MITAVAKITSSVKRFWRREDGVSSIEFVILYPIFYFLFFAGIESGLMQARQAMLERALDLSVRQIRLNTFSPPTYSQLKTMICDGAGMLHKCEDSLKLQMVIRDPRQKLELGEPQCHDEPKPLNPQGDFFPGGENQLMFLRVCVLQPPILPNLALAPYLPRTQTGEYKLYTITSYVTEPF
ncbi:TadE/TadG family type IV pilus assembly protein [Nereida sp. MMG025]|uniref:TadE/TadG family type IV pilus assembly protein n=1 Tax=Nereida sp. MMG025 TaxID=2909981 RepID=UPI001F439548|nr:TadE/TadG family type IV pilus assembly protein [Nereida sp. MMG025]MCF6445126.1 pilus assembly protein [Nereida sp. MMG025]